MKKFILFIALLMLIASATALPNFGPPNGFQTKNIVTTGYTWVKGNLYVNGTTVSNGAVDTNLTMAATKWLKLATGTGGIDFASGTGTFDTPTGTVTLNGNTVITGSKTFTSGTGAFDINGAMTSKGITQDAASSFAQSGAAGITVGTVGITASASPLKFLENTTLAANKSLTALTGSGAFDWSASSGAFSTSTGTVTLNGNTQLAGTASLTGSGVASFGALALVVNASTTVNTVLTSASKKTVYGIDAHSANVTLTLPDAATVDGRIYRISMPVDPGSYYARVTATGGDTFDGSVYWVSTDRYSSLEVIAEYGAYTVHSSRGTWAQHA